MLALVDRLEEAMRLAPILKRAGYQVVVADTLSEAARWFGDARSPRRAVIGLCDSLAPELARALAETRAAHSEASPNLRRIASGVDFDSGRQVVIVDAGVRPLTGMEARLLQVFLDHPNRPLSRAQLLDLAWGYDFHGHDREMDIYIRYLRRKIEPEPSQPRYIVTVRGIGYMLETRNQK